MSAVTGNNYQYVTNYVRSFIYNTCSHSTFSNHLYKPLGNHTSFTMATSIFDVEKSAHCQTLNNHYSHSVATYHVHVFDLLTIMAECLAKGLHREGDNPFNTGEVTHCYPIALLSVKVEVTQ